MTTTGLWGECPTIETWSVAYRAVVRTGRACSNEVVMWKSLTAGMKYLFDWMFVRNILWNRSLKSRIRKMEPRK